MRNTQSVAFPRFTHTYTDTCIQSCTHDSQRQRQHSRVSLCLWDGEKELQLPVGVDRAAAAPHRRITLERTHHLCSFVELSHFNPWPGPFGNQLCTPTTRHRAPPPVIQPCRCQHFHLCAAAVWCQVRSFSPKPPQQLACLMSVKNTGWGGEDGVYCWMLCWSVCLTFLLLFKRKKIEKTKKSTI